MTTNKRFKNVEENLEWGTVQYFTYHDEKITDKEIEKLVNHLLNQNDELKFENKNLKFENKNLKVTIEAREVLIEVCEKKFRELGFIITVDDDGYVIE